MLLPCCEDRPIQFQHRPSQSAYSVIGLPIQQSADGFEGLAASQTARVALFA
jgi:hypothetical protein